MRRGSASLRSLKINLDPRCERTRSPCNHSRMRHFDSRIESCESPRMPDDETPAPTRAATGRSTGSLKAATGPLTMQKAPDPAAADPAEATPAPGTSAAADTLPPDAPRLDTVAHLPPAPR